MSFEIGRSINGVSDRILRIPIVRTVADNPVYSAVLISLLVVIVLILVYTEDRFMYVARAAFWTFVASVVVLFLRDRSESNAREERETHAAARDVFTTPIVFADDVVPVGQGRYPAADGRPLPLDASRGAQPTPYMPPVHYEQDHPGTHERDHHVSSTVATG